MYSNVRLALIVNFLTLVLVLKAVASPESDLKPDEIDTRPLNSRANWGASLHGYRKNSQKTLSASIGSMAGTLVDASENRSSNFLGLSQTNYNHEMTSQHFGFELLQNGQLGAHLGFRTALFWGSWFEPYYQIGAGSLLKASEGPGSLINYQRYQGRAHFGFEDLFSYDRRLRLDFGVALSPLGLSYQYSLSYVFSD